MSYVFAVTKLIPKMDLNSAFERLQELREAETVENAKDLIHFVGEIKKIYPCITQRNYEYEDDDFEWVWADGSLEGNIKGNVWTFSLVSDALEEPLEFIIENANHLGFSVFSYEFEKVWWAENQVN